MNNQTPASIDTSGNDKKSRIHFEYICEEKNNVSQISAQIHNVNATDAEKREMTAASICAATGTAHINSGNMLFSQLMIGLQANGYDLTTVANAAHNSLTAMEPKDEIEGMMLSRLLLLHNNYMTFMSRVACAENIVTQERYSNMAAKLMRLYNETVQALGKYRSKGEQRVTVQYVNVNNNNAIVGTINQRGSHGKNNQKNRA
jgi:hypothetical protein